MPNFIVHAMVYPKTRTKRILREKLIPVIAAGERHAKECAVRQSHRKGMFVANVLRVTESTSRGNTP